MSDLPPKTKRDFGKIVAVSRSGEFELRALPLTGIQGPPGQDGQDGQGVPVGGSTGQVLAKKTGTDFDTEWVTGGSGDTTKDTIASGTTITTIQDTDVLAVVTPGTPNVLQKIAYSAFKTLLNGLYALTGHNHDSAYTAKNTAISGDTKTKITYDSKGLVTAGANATQDDIGDGSTYKQYSSTEKSKLSGIEASADVTDLTNVSSSINGASAVTPVDADKFPFVDADDNTIKTVMGANLKTYIGAGSGDVTADKLADGTTVTDIGTGRYVAITYPGTPNTIEKITKASLVSMLGTSFDIKGGTNGQYLKKDADDDYAFTWGTPTASLDIHGLTGESALVGTDEFPFYDDSASNNRKVTYTNLVSNLGTSFDIKGGSSGQYLKKDGSGDYAFTWDTPSGAPTKTRITDTNSPYSVSNSGDQIIVAIFTSGLTINLPQITSSNDKQTIKIYCNGYGPTVNAYSGQKIRIQGSDFDNITPSYVDITADNGLGKWLGIYG